MVKQMVYRLILIGDRFACFLPLFLTLLVFVISESAAYSQCPPVAPSGLIVSGGSPVPAPVTVPSGLVAQWKFDEGGGTVACDSSGNGNHGTLVNGPVWTTGVTGSALSFDGVNDYVKANSGARTGPFSVSLWVRAYKTNQAEWSGIFASADSPAVNTFQIDIGGTSSLGCDGQYRFYGQDQTGQNISLCFGPYTTDWQFLTATFDGTAIRVYVNGVLKASASPSFAGSIQLLKVGANRGTNLFFSGVVDEVRVYNGALSITDIQSIYQQGAANPIVATPIISPSGGEYSGPVSVTIDTATPGASIFYTTDGSSPTQSSIPYSGPMTLTTSATVKAKAFESNYNPSAEASASFTVSTIVTSRPTYYFSPTGNDSTGDGSSANPYKTFAKLAILAQPGMTFVLEDGTYSASNSGNRLALNCASSGGNTVNGTAQHPIVVQAQNERMAFIQNDGSSAAVTVSNCSYWNFLGLRAEGQDLPGSYGGNVVEIYNSSNIQFKRGLVRKNNRYVNSHLLLVEGNSSNVLIEENELYEHHRGGVMFTQLSHDNIARRNYCNSRNYPDIPGGYPSIDQNKGDECFMNYPSYNNIIENNITENEASCFNTQASGVSDNNKFYGNIALGCNIIVKSYNTLAGNTPQGNVYTNQVIVSLPNVTNVPMYFRTQRGGRCDNCTIIASNTNAALVSDVESGAGDGGPYSFYASNLLILRTANPNTYGAAMSTNFGIDHANSYGSNTAFSPFPNAAYTNTSTVNPQMGSCYAWLPASSPMKRAGINGADIGANVLYVYQNGTLTTNKLWDPTTNTFASAYLGANVPGITDVAGNSLRNIGARLHLGPANGCDYPTGY